MAAAGSAYDKRVAARDEVHYRTRGTAAGGRIVDLLIVNLSAQGLMARSEAQLAVGERLIITLPVIGMVTAELRWSLGGRIGCELDRPIELASYYDLLSVLVRGR
ncbi:PilZ domain-containing protein [uncultured Sphingomonas sp.]|uniref:PilZ domain-containing protein n=1 Tax=uncultured Sphingomonas sp. TaxID=158754 RepID=UPI0035CC2F76